MNKVKWYKVWCGEITEISVKKETEHFVGIEHSDGTTSREKKETDFSFISKTIKECKDWYFRKTREEIVSLEDRIDVAQMNLEDFIASADALEYQNGANE